MEFEPECSHTFCRICGITFQSELDRTPEPDAMIEFEARMRRMEWSHKHAKTHPAREHEALEKSGRFLTPEAAVKLVPLGIIPVQDIVFSDESEHAGLEAPRMPTDDVEDVLKGYVNGR